MKREGKKLNLGSATIVKKNEALLKLQLRDSILKKTRF